MEEKIRHLLIFFNEKRIGQAFQTTNTTKRRLILQDSNDPRITKFNEQNQIFSVEYLCLINGHWVWTIDFDNKSITSDGYTINGVLINSWNEERLNTIYNHLLELLDEYFLVQEMTETFQRFGKSISCRAGRATNKMISELDKRTVVSNAI